MSLKEFLKLVEIQTKVASVFPFLLGTIYALFHFNTFSMNNFIFMFLSLISFDMATTAINNYMDYKKAIKTKGYGYEIHNAVVKYNLEEYKVVLLIALLIIVATTNGFILFLNTDFIVLILGGISFLIGIIYSFGPIPISRTPFGELLSGFFMGFIIIFISIYIHVYDLNIITIMVSRVRINSSINFIEILYIFLISIPSFIGISNIMLANNICDMEEDLYNKRYTLPIYIGKEKALKLFKYSYYLVYIDLVFTVILKIEPYVSLLTLLTIVPVLKNVKRFCEKQSKENTFVLAVKNFIFINATKVVILGFYIVVIKLF